MDVTIVDHPIQRIEVEDITLLESVNNSNSNYNLHPNYTIYFKDGTTKYIDYSNDPDPGASADIVINEKRFSLNLNSWELQEQNPWTPGNSYEVTGKLLDVTDTFTVTVNFKSLTHIAVLYRPYKLTYTIGEPLDTDGLIVASYYDNKFVERITDYSVSGYDPQVLGKQTVTITYQGVTTTFQVNVLPIDVTGIQLNKQELPMITGDSTQLIAMITPVNATDKTVVWVSSDPATVSVDADGNVQALRAGQATITATTQDGGLSANCKVYVVCNHKKLIYQEAVSSDCTNVGYRAHYSCSTCDALFKNDKETQTTLANETVPAVGHKYADATATQCSVCGELRVHEHDYVAATCTTPKTCKLCGATSGKALGHKSDMGTVTNVATCIVTGTKVYRCTTCGEKLKSETIAKVAHTYDAGKVTTQATCTNTGVKTYTCSVCKGTKTETIAKKAHTYSNATCTKAKTCKVCGVTSGKALGHSYKAATCTAPKTCKVCKATTGKALGHKYTNACDTSCNVCNATRKITHKYATVTKKATANANGYTVKRCSVCSKETGKTIIYKASTIKLSKTTYTYNGKVQKPTVTVKDSKGKTIATSNYTVTYASGRKNVGTYKVTVKFKGKYTGTKTLTFKINPAGTTVKSVTAGTKKLTINVAKKTAQVTGYEIQYATNKSFKSAKTKTLSSYKKTSLSLTGLKAKTTYYIRVRTYKIVNGKKMYSDWSAVKSAKTK